MNTSNNTVLITGGSAGIGFEIARLFSEQNNHVIIVGRNEERLQSAAAKLKNVTAIQADVNNEQDLDALAARIRKDFPQLNILVNNAGKAFVYRLSNGVNVADKATEEILTNYIAIIRLTEKLLPVLNAHTNSAIVNVSSIVSFVPVQSLPTYSASKAALHSYTQALRFSLSNTTSTKVFELMPPLVNTDFSKEIGGEKGIPPTEVAETLLAALAKDEYEIHVAGTAQLYQLFRQSPADALLAMNQAE